MISVSNFKVKNFCVATPYLVPKYLNKKVNIGDGFIFDSSIKLIKYNPHLVISSREELDDKKIDIINSSKMLIVTGANIIKDNFEIIRGFKKKILDKIKVPIALMGIGHYGVSDTNQNGFDANSVSLIKELIKRFPLISVRCKGSYDYVKKSLGENFLKYVVNTSCPVILVMKVKKQIFTKRYLQTFSRFNN